MNWKKLTGFIVIFMVFGWIISLDVPDWSALWFLISALIAWQAWFELE